MHLIESHTSIATDEGLLGSSRRFGRPEWALVTLVMIVNPQFLLEEALVFLRPHQ
jgi:hypothetical protein